MHTLLGCYPIPVMGDYAYGSEENNVLSDRVKTGDSLRYTTIHSEWTKRARTDPFRNENCTCRASEDIALSVLKDVW